MLGVNQNKKIVISSASNLNPKLYRLLWLQGIDPIPDYDYNVLLKFFLAGLHRYNTRLPCESCRFESQLDPKRWVVLFAA